MDLMQKIMDMYRSSCTFPERYLRWEKKVITLHRFKIPCDGKLRSETDNLILSNTKTKQNENI